MLNSDVDWTRVIGDIINSGLPLERMHRPLRVSRTTVVRWMEQERSPGHRNGHNLLLLWGEKTGRSPLDPPTV